MILCPLKMASRCAEAGTETAPGKQTTPAAISAAIVEIAKKRFISLAPLNSRQFRRTAIMPAAKPRGKQESASPAALRNSLHIAARVCQPELHRVLVASPLEG